MLRFSEDWHDSYLARRAKKTTISKKKKSKPPATAKYISPHTKALASLARKPELAKGNEEHYSQVRYFDYFERNYPSIYELLHATPNGGYRTKKTGAAMRAEGQKKGYPDLSLDIAMQGYHGLRIEMKSGRNSLTEDQIIWRDRLIAQGFMWVECRSTEEAIAITLEYMNIKDTSDSEHNNTC